MINEILRGAFEKALLIINNENKTHEKKLREVKLIIKENPELANAYFESPDPKDTRLFFAAAAQDCLELVKYF